MSLISLLLVIVMAFLLSNSMDAFPGVLWGWVHWPQWLLWGGLLALVTWCIGDQKSD